MPRKTRYQDVYIPQNLVPLLKDRLDDPEVKHKLLVRNLPNTPQGLVKLIVQEFLENKRNQRQENEPTQKATDTKTSTP